MKGKDVIIEGMLATHNSKPFLGHVTVDENGLIKNVKKGKAKNPDLKYGKECLVFPGFGDIHIHAREDETGKQNYKEDYKTASDAAINGGVVYVCAMPNTPSPVVNKKTFDWHRNQVENLNHSCDIFNYLGIDKNTRPLGKPGEYFYKLYFGKSVGDLTVTYGDELDTILSRYVGQYISFHVEYEPIVQANVSGLTHSDRRPRECVNEGLLLLLPLIQKYKIHAKLCHWSTGGKSFKMIEEFRKKGCDIVLEVSPLHLLFDKSMTDEDPSLWLKVQMNPAIQSKEDRKDLIKGLRTGFIQFLATDHAPHTLEEKYSAFSKFRNESSFEGLTNKQISEKIYERSKEEFNKTCCENGHSGAPWLDTYALVATHLMHKEKFTPQDIARVSAYNPGNFVNKFLKKQNKNFKKYGLGFGQIKKGYLANFTVLNMHEKTGIKKENLKTKVGWSPLEDWYMPGKIEAVIVEGKIIKN